MYSVSRQDPGDRFPTTIISYIEYVQGFGMNYIQACNNGLASIKKEFRKRLESDKARGVI